MGTQLTILILSEEVGNLHLARAFLIVNLTADLLTQLSPLTAGDTQGRSEAQAKRNEGYNSGGKIKPTVLPSFRPLGLGFHWLGGGAAELL